MRFVPAIVVSAALVLAAPAIGQVRSAFLAAFPNYYRLILLSVVLGAAALVVLASIARIRARHALRYGALVLALAIAATYSWLSRTGDPSVDAVERFHFVEYGFITLLFYWAWRPVGDGSLLLLPVVAGLLVGTCEEWLQWFVPARVGEVRDIFLNLWAIVCGLLFSVALDPPDRLSVHLTPASWKRARRFSAVVLLVFAGFFHSVHLGYAIDDPAGRFYSAYDTNQLEALGRERAERWQTHPPLTWRRYSREDQYFSEGVALVRVRNRCWEGGDIRCAAQVNGILERHYAPVLDTPSYVSPSGLRWPAEQRDDARRRTDQQPVGFSALEEESIIYTFSKPLFWGIVGVAVSLLVFL